jgi:hypothetical protein
MASCCSKKGCIDKGREFLKIISIGKYSTKLYYRGKGFKGSVLTGILTVLMTLFLIYYFIVVFWEIINH